MRAIPREVKFRSSVRLSCYEIHQSVQDEQEMSGSYRAVAVVEVLQPS